MNTKINSNHYVYALKATDEDQYFYIGKTKHLKPRYNHHLNNCTKVHSAKSTKIISILERKANVEMIVLFTTIFEQEAFDKEKELITLYGRKDNGTGILCNHTDGGEGSLGYTLSVEHIKKLRRANIGKTVSAETRNKIRNHSILQDRTPWYKPVTCYLVDRPEVALYFSSFKEAASELKCKAADISQHINRNTPRAVRGIHGRYIFKLSKLGK